MRRLRFQGRRSRLVLSLIGFVIITFIATSFYGPPALITSLSSATGSTPFISGFTNTGEVSSSAVPTSQGSSLKGIPGKPFVNPPNEHQQGQVGVRLTLSLDKISFDAGSVATVTIVIENSGNQVLAIGNAEQSVELVVYDTSMNQVGNWIRFQRVLAMHPLGSPFILGAGQTYSWTFTWNLRFYSNSGTGLHQLPIADYNLQAKINLHSGGSSLELGPEPAYTIVTSNIIRFSII